MTEKQLIDLETIEYFMPFCYRHLEITDKDREKFLEHSEKGLHEPDERVIDGFNALVQGKVWRGRHMHELYEEGVLEGTMPYSTILGLEEGDTPVPRSVMEFMAKEIFKGQNAKQIRKLYNQSLDKSDDSNI